LRYLTERALVHVQIMSDDPKAWVNSTNVCDLARSIGVFGFSGSFGFGKNFGSCIDSQVRGIWMMVLLAIAAA
jgi:hypothetical protein